MGIQRTRVPSTECTVPVCIVHFMIAVLELPVVVRHTT